MAQMIRADELRRRDQVLVTFANGRTIATIQGSEVGLTERDLASPDLAKFVPERPVIGLHVLLSRAISVPSVPNWRATLITIWAAPDELFERYV